MGAGNDVYGFHFAHVAGCGGTGVGGGVQVTSIRRLASDFQNQQLWRATTEKQYYGTTQQYLGALEGLVDSEGSSISVGLDNFYAALSEASSTPSGASIAISRGRWARTVGSPPVRRISVMPASTAIRATVTISSLVNNVSRAASGTPSAGMQ